MQTNTVTAAYLLGVKEGRESLRFMVANGVDRAEYLASVTANLKELLAQGYGGEARESLRGQIDFARNQVRVGA